LDILSKKFYYVGQPHNFTTNNVVMMTTIHALGFTQPLTEMSTRSRKIMFLASEVLLVCRADNLAAICEPILSTMWDPKYLPTL
jgi:hypothetical protein